MKPTLALAAAALLVGGCGSRRHLTETHGRAYREAFARQTVNPKAGGGPQQKPGLDSQEAAIVVKNYQRTLQREPAGEADRSLILVAPQQAAGGLMPPPSVPPAR